MKLQDLSIYIQQNVAKTVSEMAFKMIKVIDIYLRMVQ